MQVGLITDNYNFLINNMDIESINLKPYSYGGANITVFRILDSENSELKIFEDFLREEMAAAAADAADNTQTDEDEDENKVDGSSNDMDRISLFIAQDIKSESCIEEGKPRIANSRIWSQIVPELNPIQSIFLFFRTRFYSQIEKSTKRANLWWRNGIRDGTWTTWERTCANTSNRLQRARLGVAERLHNFEFHEKCPSQSARVRELIGMHFAGEILGINQSSGIR